MWRQNRASRESDTKKLLTEYKTPIGKTLRQPRVWLSVALFFLYVGAETSLGIWAYSLLTKSRGVDKTLAGIFTGSYWFTFTMGRIMAGMVASRVGSDKLVLTGLLGALLGSGLLIWNPSEMVNVFALVFIGLSIAPIISGDDVGHE